MMTEEKPMLANIKSPLSRKAVLVAVNISQWTARKLDRKVTKQAIEANNAAKDAGRFNKLLIDAKHLKRITELVSAARALHYKMTKPWLDEGPRILPNALYVEFTTEFNKIKKDFVRAVEKFCDEYPRYVEDRKRALGEMFHQAEFPPVEEMRGRFNMDIKFGQIGDAEDFRSDLDQEIAEDIRREIAEQTSVMNEGIRKDTLKQIAETVGHMAEKLSKYNPKSKENKSYFRDSLVDNVRELARLLPSFNIDNDPALTAIASRIAKELCAEDATVLRENDMTREVVAKSADDIVKAVEGLIA
jgi:Protein of unknown function (DUF3150)